MESNNSQRIAKNTGILYARMFFLMLISLYTSRVILNALGVEDFGINNVVAGFVGLLAFFTSSLSNVSQRYISIGLGKKAPQITTLAFKQSVTLMLVFSGIVLLLGETIGLWFVCNKLVIPASRLTASIWIYQFALLSTLCSVNQVTFNAAIVAHEKMGMYAYLAIFEAVAKLAIAFMLQWSSSDHLILYGFLTAVVSVVTFAFYITYCVTQFSEAKCRLCWNKVLVKEMSGFISANLFGCFAWAIGVQGVNIILNMFFGPVVNAARGVAVQITSVVTRFTENVMTAMKPQIIKSYAGGDMEYMKLLIEKSTKYIAMLSIALALPIIFEAQYILQLWLGQVPDYTVSFVRLVLIEQIVNVVVPPLWIATNATGNIKRNQVYGRMFTIGALPVSYLLLLVIKEPVLPMCVLIVAAFGYAMYCLYDVKRQIGLDIPRYLKKSILPACIFMGSLVVTDFGNILLSPNDCFVRLVAVCLSTLCVGSLVGYLVLEKTERAFVKQIIKKVL